MLFLQYEASMLSGLPLRHVRSELLILVCLEIAGPPRLKAIMGSMVWLSRSVLALHDHRVRWTSYQSGETESNLGSS